jgi:hypothetical protein
LEMATGERPHVSVEFSMAVVQRGSATIGTAAMVPRH